jgi:hypothetical protein
VYSSSAVKLFFILASPFLAITSMSVQPPAESCPVHNVAMAYVELPYKTTGELTAEQVEETKVRGKLFPYGLEFTPAGCVVEEEDGGMGTRNPMGFLCLQCVEARLSWLKEFSKDQK